MKESTRSGLVAGVGFFEGKKLLERAAVAFGWGRELRVADGRAVATHVDGVHDGEGAAYSKEEAEEETDGGGPVNAHDRWSLS
jgi:hypothetical protein